MQGLLRTLGAGGPLAPSAGGLVKNAYGTASMEGNRLKLEQVRELAAPQFRHQMLVLIHEHIRSCSPSS